MNYPGPVYSKSYSHWQFIVSDSRYEIPLKYVPLVFNRKPARFGGYHYLSAGQQTSDSSSYSTSRDACAINYYSLIEWSSRCQPVLFNDTLPTLNYACLRTMVLHLRSVMLVYVQWCFSYVQWYFTYVRWCSDTSPTCSDASPTLNYACQRSITLYLRSVITVILQIHSVITVILHLRSVTLRLYLIVIAYVLQ